MLPHEPQRINTEFDSFFNFFTMATSGTVRLAQRSSGDLPGSALWTSCIRKSSERTFHPVFFSTPFWQTGYDPKNTFINEGQLQYWLKNKVSADLESVPGVGPANKHHFVAGEL